jgi:rubrerythrin
MARGLRKLLCKKRRIIVGANLSIGEIVELGIQIEINGKDFYNTVAKNEENKNAKEVFLYLAGEEEKHMKTFDDLLKSLQNYEPKEAYPEEYFSYMNSLAGESVFTKEHKGEEIAEKVKDAREAIDLAIGFEKDSVKFYEGVKKGVPEGDKNIIEQLIQEEKKHAQTLLALRKNYPGSHNA